MAKNVVICLDGTGNELKAKGNTNVVELYDLLDLSDPAKQVAYYDPGVGTFSAPGAWTPPARFVSRVSGLAFGSGMRANLAEAYTYLMRVYEPGDRIYVFGFSRGAYTARALTGLVHTVGIFRPGAENLVQYAVASYTRRKSDWKQLDEFRETFAHPPPPGERHVPIEYLGLWDTVKAAGLLRWDAKWPYTKRIVNVRKVRHAVSIDEYRRPYSYYPALPYVRDDTVTPDIYEVWFAGVHSDVGGTFPDPRLARITLKWMVQGARKAQVLFKPGPYGATCASVTVDNASGKVHRMGRVWVLAGYRKRVVPPRARVHDSVRERLAAVPEYPFTLPEGASYADEHWST